MQNKQSTSGFLGLLIALMLVPLTSVQAGGDGGDDVEAVEDLAAPKTKVDPTRVISRAKSAYPLGPVPAQAGSLADAHELVYGLESSPFCGVDANVDSPLNHSSGHISRKLIPAAAAILEGALLVDTYNLERIVDKIGQSSDPLAPQLLIYAFDNSRGIVAPSIIARYGDEMLAMSDAEIVDVVGAEVERSAAGLRRKAIRASAGTVVEEYLISEGLDDHNLAVQVAAAQRAAGFGELFLVELSVLCADNEVFCRYYDSAEHQ